MSAAPFSNRSVAYLLLGCIAVAAVTVAYWEYWEVLPFRGPTTDFVWMLLTAPVLMAVAALLVVRRSRVASALALVTGAVAGSLIAYLRFVSRVFDAEAHGLFMFYIVSQVGCAVTVFIVIERLWRTTDS